MRAKYKCHKNKQIIGIQKFTDQIKQENLHQTINVSYPRQREKSIGYLTEIIFELNLFLISPQKIIILLR